MTKDDIDKLWHQAMSDSIKNGEDFTRYRFANLVVNHEREACVRMCNEADKSTHPADLAAAIRARGNT